jgi:hypothetical protein
MRIIAFLTHAPAIHSLLTYLGEPTAPPGLAPARGPQLPRCFSYLRTTKTSAKGSPLSPSRQLPIRCFSRW